MKKIELKANAKINPSLEILSKRKDGYHNLKLTYLSVDLYDVIKIESNKKCGIKIHGQIDIPLRKNICFKAAQSLLDMTGKNRGAIITLEKNIPIGGGLGGGSSDAAAVLTGLNRIWETNLKQEELEKLGGRLGSDVPFFFRGGFQLGEGWGNKLTKKENPYKDRKFILIKPEFSLSTPEVYSKYDTLNTKNGRKVRKEVFRNDLTRAALKLQPSLKEYFWFLNGREEVEDWSMSGSGSAMFALMKEKIDIQKVVKKAKSFFPKANVYSISSVEKGHTIINHDEL